MSDAQRAVWIGPSVLSADFLRLGEQLAEVARAGADYIHFDVMDGNFVPNISVGLPILEAVRQGTSLPVDVHLMIVEPAQWVDAFREAGADRITVHVEASDHLHRVVQTIERAGALPGVSLNPATPVSAIEEVVPYVGQILVMSVNPGFGGQSFIPTMLDKISRVRELIDRKNPGCRLEVDGGINTETIAGV
ncbi:MAG TPA: ribulose-phosphate 3-epimerase, partial [Thermomicrobiales bacterium]|nr:ribulose-phosphate 3-epimerase [Thermomicrobiales bacterium]